MQKFQGVGPYSDIVEVRSPADPTQTVKLGLRTACYKQNLQIGLHTTIAQYFCIVQDGTMSAVHLFRGIKRPLMYGNNKDVDKSVLVYSWRPVSDYVGSGGRFDNWRINARVPPVGRVFVVLVVPESHPVSYPDVGMVVGSIEKWNWVKEDSQLPNAPDDWKERYEEKLWSR